MRRAGTALLLLATATAGGGAKPQVRHVFTRNGVVVTLLPGEGEAKRARGFLVRAADAEEGSRYAGFRALCALPEEESALRDFRLVLLPKLREKEPRLRAFQVVTGMEPATVAELKRAALASEEPVTVRPAWKKGRIEGFELTLPPPPREEGPGAPAPPLLVKIPPDRPPTEEHALVLKPRWREPGRTIAGYDVILASVAAIESESAAIESERRPPR